jgi:hypothetical protein
MCKEGVLYFKYFTAGDYVRTPEGVGIVCEDEQPIVEERDFCTSEVKIQHKFGSSNNTNNMPIDVIREYVSRITKEEYVSEKELIFA